MIDLTVDRCLQLQCSKVSGDSLELDGVFADHDVWSFEGKIYSPNWEFGNILTSIRGAIFHGDAGKHALEVRTWTERGRLVASLRFGWIAAVPTQLSRQSRKAQMKRIVDVKPLPRSSCQDEVKFGWNKYPLFAYFYNA